MPRVKTYPTGESNPELVIISVNIPKRYKEYVKTLIEWGKIPGFSEYFRLALHNQIQEDLKTQEYIESVIKPSDRKSIQVPNGDGTVTHYRLLRRLESNG